MSLRLPIFVTALVTSLILSTSAWAQQSVFDETFVEKDNWEPAIPRPEQEKVAAAKLQAFEQGRQKRPNILIFLVDDMGWGDPGVYGGGTAIGAPTPNIDKLANGGLRLTSMYSQPTCTSSRAAMMTGRLPVRSGLVRPILTGDKVSKNPWEIEIAQAKLLSEAGYETALIGKCISARHRECFRTRWASTTSSACRRCSRTTRSSWSNGSIPT